MDSVAIIRCDEYRHDKVRHAIERCLDLLGGVSAFIKPGMRVLLKCNLLSDRPPAECVTTHPAVVEALVRILQEAGAIPVIGDSPGGPYTARALGKVYRVCGMEDVVARTGAQLNYNTDVAEVYYPEGKVIKKITVIKVLQEVDAVISISKLKTHGMTTFTGAVKNLFGVIPGTTKAEYHFRMRELKNFADMLVDICMYVKPILSFMDAVIGMEGNGPSAGSPRKIGAILASTSPFALDVAAASMVGIPPEKIPTIKSAGERGLCSRLEEVELLGDDFEELKIDDFDVPALRGLNLPGRLFSSKSRLGEFLIQHLGPRPVFDRDVCVGCRVCEKNCPPRAISTSGGRPVVNLKKCIRCFCCQELCPEKAVSIKRSWIFRLLG